MKPRKLLRKLAAGAFQNVAFPDLRHLVEAFGFELLRTQGSHHIFAHPGIPELANLQEVQG
jgi:virulence-associated protein VapD